MSLISVTYVSSARTLLSEQAIEDLLAVSRRNNTATDITGLLLYWDGNFLQYVEGPEQTVDTLLERIRLDPRHGDVIVLDRAPINERAFPDWRMGYQRLTEGPSQDTGVSTFLGDGRLGEQAAAMPPHVRHLIEIFRKNLS
jgi:Sensors of blue-light using FAD